VGLGSHPVYDGTGIGQDSSFRFVRNGVEYCEASGDCAVKVGPGTCVLRSRMLHLIVATIPAFIYTAEYHSAEPSVVCLEIQMCPVFLALSSLDSYEYSML